LNKGKEAVLWGKFKRCDKLLSLPLGSEFHPKPSP